MIKDLRGITMPSSPTEQAILNALSSMDIIDGHEHFGPEAARLATPVDVFSLFSHYTHYDLRNAGMSEADYQKLFQRELPLAQRWALFAPYWKLIRWTSYSRAARLTLQRFYGAEDVHDGNYAELSAQMRAANTPGIFRRVLCDACRIRTVLANYWPPVPPDGGLFASVLPLLNEDKMTRWDDLAHPLFEPDACVATLDDYLEAIRRYTVRGKQAGAVAFKWIVRPDLPPDRAEAERVFTAIKRDGGRRVPWSQDMDLTPLTSFVADWGIRIATEQDLVIAVHTGYWHDFRKLHPADLIPVLRRHPDTRFDVFHVGYPYMREALMLAKGFPNVWLNFCWTHILSQHFARAALDEALDLLPVNKVTAFGGDYGVEAMEKVYGHLVMAREDVAAVLAGRVDRGGMSADEALRIARRWFWDNPKELYRLNV
jgi:uncharacterized protein